MLLNADASLTAKSNDFDMSAIDVSSECEELLKLYRSSSSTLSMSSTAVEPKPPRIVRTGKNSITVVLASPEDIRSHDRVDSVVKIDLRVVAVDRDEDSSTDTKKRTEDTEPHAVVVKEVSSNGVPLPLRLTIRLRDVDVVRPLRCQVRYSSCLGQSKWSSPTDIIAFPTPPTFAPSNVRVATATAQKNGVARQERLLVGRKSVTLVWSPVKATPTDKTPSSMPVLSFKIQKRVVAPSKSSVVSPETTTSTGKHGEGATKPLTSFYDWENAADVDVSCARVELKKLWYVLAIHTYGDLHFAHHALTILAMRRDDEQDGHRIRVSYRRGESGGRWAVVTNDRRQDEGL